MHYTNTFDRFTPYALAALRIVAALIFMEHGTQKLFGFPAAPANGLPAVLSLYWIGAIMELGGGFLILIGAFTRPVAFLLAGEMAVAYSNSQGSNLALRYPSSTQRQRSHFCYSFCSSSEA